MRNVISGITVALVFCGILLVLGAEVQAQYCYPMASNHSNACTAVTGGTTGKCCCNVTCSGSETGVECTCSLGCETTCGTPCPDCDFCEGARAAAGEEGFLLTPEARSRAGQTHLLAAQVLKNVSGPQSRPVYSRMVQGKSNVGSPHDYSYKVRVTASPSQAIMEFVFDQVDNNTAPIPVRLVVDEAGNVSTSVLGSTEAEALRAQAAETCSTPAMSSADPSLNLLNPGGTLAQILAIHK